jgi:hypothetical protein
MPKKKSHHHKPKHKSHHHSHLAFDHEPTGHHARLRKHHHADGGHHSAGGSHADGHHRKTRKKASKRAAPAHKRSALMKRLRAAEAGAREQLRSFGRRHKHHQPEKTVTEQTLRNHMALKCVRRCSH